MKSSIFTEKDTNLSLRTMIDGRVRNKKQVPETINRCLQDSILAGSGFFMQSVSLDCCMFFPVCSLLRGRFSCGSAIILKMLCVFPKKAGAFRTKSPRIPIEACGRINDTTFYVFLVTNTILFVYLLSV